MRVIAGEFRSRVLKSLPGLDVRPTPDRLRESLFNVLTPKIQNAVFLDAYAGTGSVGIEALSRGATRVIFIENNRAAWSIIRENLNSLGIENRAEIVRGKVAQALAKYPADIVFLDPPYTRPAEYDASLGELASEVPPLVIVQHDVHLALQDSYGPLSRYRTLRQGDNVLSFYSPVVS
jgi:16S rRNA (guanine(966)-N(2))-methyltransferase RsmD